MRKDSIILLLALVAVLFISRNAGGVEEAKVQVCEYATVRFMEEKTSIVWPDGKVDKVIPLSGLKRPETADYRMFWLTVSMNIMAKRGFEFVHMDGPDVIMKRTVAK